MAANNNPAVIKNNQFYYIVENGQRAAVMADPTFINGLTQQYYVRESDGKWLNFALPKVLELFDRYQDCTISIKAPKLKIRHKINRTEVLAKKDDPKNSQKTSHDKVAASDLQPTSAPTADNDLEEPLLDSS